MSIVNTVRGKNASNSPPQFWWEEGYDASKQGVTTTVTNNRIEYDAEGETFEITKYTTDLNHMDSLFFHHDNNTIVSLRHQRSRSASIAIFSYTEECGLVPITIYDIGDNSGYMALSHDDKMIAVGVLKEDLVMIFDVMTGELLVNVTGGYKLGYWGHLQFLPGNNNNTLIEVRTISMDKVGKAKETVVRTWDLGFQPPDASSDCDDDEETVKVWEIKRRGNVSCIRHENTMICAAEMLQKLEWLDPMNGSILRQLSFSSWISKPVISSDGLYVATAHFGYCLIHHIVTSEIVAKIMCPQNESNYPLIPIQFVNQNSFLVCRITQERALIISAWSLKTAHSTAYIHHVGGTISDNSIRISSNEKYLICWPYGVLELYDMEGMINILKRKLSRYQQLEIMKMRYLIDNHRATVKTTSPQLEESRLDEKKSQSQTQQQQQQSQQSQPQPIKSSLKGKKQTNLTETTQDKSKGKSKRDGGESSQDQLEGEERDGEDHFGCHEHDLKLLKILMNEKIFSKDLLIHVLKYL